MVNYSYSKLQTFVTCPFKYKLRYIDRIRTSSQGIEAFMGQRVHESLEALYKDVMMNKTPKLEQLVEGYAADWRENWRQDIAIARPEYTAEDYQSLGERCLRDYFGRHHPFDSGKIAGLEKQIFVDIGGHKFRGFIDRLTIVGDGELEIHDYKSSSSLPNQAQLDQDKQLALYQIGVEQLWPHINKVHLVWHYLVFDQEMRSYRTAAELQELKEDFVSQIEKIDRATAAGDFEAIEGPLCGWCDLKGHCPKKSHMCRVSALPENEYLNDEGVCLVDRYAELEAERQSIRTAADAQVVAIEGEMDRVKAAILDYASKHEAEVLVGTEHELKIKEQIKIKFPAKGTTERRELDALLKREGLWPSVSDLNGSSLNKLIAEEKIEQGLLARIEEFRQSNTTSKISLAKFKDPSKTSG